MEKEEESAETDIEKDASTSGNDDFRSLDERGDRYLVYIAGEALVTVAGAVFGAIIGIVVALPESQITLPVIVALVSSLIFVILGLTFLYWSEQGKVTI